MPGELVAKAVDKMLVDSLVEGVQSFCARACDNGIRAAVLAIPPLTAAPVLAFAGLFAGAMWFDWRKESKQESQLRSLFAELRDALAVAASDSAKTKEMIEALYTRDQFVRARISGADWADQRRAIIEDVRQLLSERGLNDHASTTSLQQIDAWLGSLQETLNDIRHDTQSILTGMQSMGAAIQSVVEHLLVDRAEKDAEIDRLRERLRSAIEASVDAERIAGRPIERVLEELQRGDSRHLLEFLDRCVEKDNARSIENHRKRAAAAYLLGDPDRAANSVDAILRLVPNDPEALDTRVRLYMLKEELEQADAACYELLKAREPLARAMALHHLGTIRHRQGRLTGPNGAWEMHVRSGELVDLYEYPAFTASRFRAAAAIMKDLGLFDDAERTLKAAIVADRSAVAVNGLADDYLALGDVKRLQGHLDAAEKLYRDSLELSKNLRCELGMANAWTALGYRLLQKNMIGGAEGAGVLILKAARIYERCNRKAGVADAVTFYAELCRRTGKLEESLNWHGRALALYCQSGNAEGLAKSCALMGRVLKGMGECQLSDGSVTVESHVAARAIMMQARAWFVAMGRTTAAKEVDCWLDKPPREPSKTGEVDSSG
ncbi:MAG: hypothetical protein H7Y88_03760 [Phycisphaerales bacterium]|nr:hypothetical protein [Phycisphaerales bacterium]